MWLDPEVDHAFRAPAQQFFWLCQFSGQLCPQAGSSGSQWPQQFHTSCFNTVKRKRTSWAGFPRQPRDSLCWAGMLVHMLTAELVIVATEHCMYPLVWCGHMFFWRSWEYSHLSGASWTPTWKTGDLRKGNKGMNTGKVEQGHIEKTECQHQG